MIKINEYKIFTKERRLTGKQSNLDNKLSIYNSFIKQDLC